MNTVGAWQEAFNWLLSRIFKHSVPVAIYKYGVVRPGAVLKFRQRRLIWGLNARIRRLSGETQKSGFGGVPDVIAHSFGTWLLGHALQADPDLRVGRVILTGCILRPDFDWAALIPSQVEAVLCHTATKDLWGRIAHYIIPDSGPSGLVGFNDRSTIAHAILHGGRHSDFFGDSTMTDLFETVWRPFLSAPSKSPLLSGNGLSSPNWKQALWPLRATVLRIALLLCVLTAIMAGIAALCLGFADLWHFIFS
jgi:serine/threonine-protein kinase